MCVCSPFGVSHPPLGLRGRTEGREREGEEEEEGRVGRQAVCYWSDDISVTLEQCTTTAPSLEFSVCECVYVCVLAEDQNMELSWLSK